MQRPGPNYLPIKLRTQARNVWIATLIAVSLWLAVIIAAPILAASGLTSMSSPVYTFFSYVCHQIPERSFYLADHQFAVCSRCFGVYSGLLIGILVYPLWRRIDEIEPIPRIWLFLSMIPIGIDWSLTIFGIWENTHASRFITGFILGAACATYIVPALVEVTRNLTAGRLRTQ